MFSQSKLAHTCRCRIRNPSAKKGFENVTTESCEHKLPDLTSGSQAKKREPCNNIVYAYIPNEHEQVMLRCKYGSKSRLASQRCMPHHGNRARQADFATFTLCRRFQGDLATMITCCIAMLIVFCRLAKRFQVIVLLLKVQVETHREVGW